MKKLLLATALVLAAPAIYVGANSLISLEQAAPAPTARILEAPSFEAGNPDKAVQHDLKTAADLLNAALRDPSAFGQAGNEDEKSTDRGSPAPCLIAEEIGSAMLGERRSSSAGEHAGEIFHQRSST